MTAPGDILLDKYRVERVIGKGGMATVVAATHLQLNEPVAIKLLLPHMLENTTVVQRFLREARAAVRLKGEHSVRVLDVGTLPGGAPYMVMELLEGTDLGVSATKRGRFPAPEAVDYVIQACEALAEAHAAGIVHRDIKPSNLFVTRRPDGSPLLKVLDFGISKVNYEERVTELTQDSIVGTPSYMSPEQLRGSEVDGRADVWSLGIVLYRLLAGVRPFKADNLSALAIQAATEPTPPLPPPFPPGLDQIIYRCLAKDAAHRYQSVAELAFALAPYAGDPRTAAIVIERTQNILRWSPPVPAPPPVAQAVAPVVALEPTTLGSSAGAMQVPVVPRRRSPVAWVIGGSTLAGVLAAIAISASGGDDLRPAGAPRAVPATPGVTGGATGSTPTVEPIIPAETPTTPADTPTVPATPGAGSAAVEPDPAIEIAPTTTATTATTTTTTATPAQRPRPRTRPGRPKTDTPSRPARPPVKTEPAGKPRPVPANPLDTRM